MKYKVYGLVTVPFFYEVEADDIEEAVELTENTDVGEFEIMDWATDIKVKDARRDD